MPMKQTSFVTLSQYSSASLPIRTVIGIDTLVEGGRCFELPDRLVRCSKIMISIVLSSSADFTSCLNRFLPEKDVVRG